MARLMAARDRWAKVSGQSRSIVLCYEAGYDAFWLARFLKARGIECLVVDAASVQVIGAPAGPRRIGSMSACCCGR